MEPEPEPEPRDEPATGRAGAVGGSWARPPQMAIDRRLEAVLRDQIERLADPRANFEMHRWWNWDPEGPWDPEGGGAHCRHDGPPPAGEWVDTAPAQRMEVVVADLHDRVIESCREWFARLGLPRPCLLQAPVQEALLAYALHGAEDVLTFLVFGAYGNGQVESALQKQLMEAFPAQMHSIQAQARAGCGNGEADCSHEELMRLNMANQGRVWVAQPAPTDPIQLVGCAAYPRCQVSLSLSLSPRLSLCV